MINAEMIYRIQNPNQIYRPHVVGCVGQYDISHYLAFR